LISTLYSDVPPQYDTGDIPSAIEFEFLYTSEKQGWIEEITPRFEDWFKTRFNISISVSLVVTGTHDSVNRLLDGSAKPTVWSPASSIWIPYMNRKWRSVTGSNSDIAVDWTPLVLSPVVLASWDSQTNKYGVSSFMDLYHLSMDNVDFKYGHPDPLLSNGGTMTVILEFAEAAGKKPEELTVEDLRNETIIEIVKRIESHAIYYGKSTGFFGSWAAEQGPSGIDFFGVYENVVLDNSLKAFKTWNDRLIAIYSQQGTLIADHPFVVLNAPWTNIWQRFAAGYYLLFLLSPDIQESSQNYGFRPASSSVPLNQTLFSATNGVQFEIDVPVLKPLKGEVMEAIFTAWVKVRNSGT
jgi:Ca-activated chloride channel family protein